MFSVLGSGFEVQVYGLRVWGFVNSCVPLSYTQILSTIVHLNVSAWERAPAENNIALDAGYAARSRGAASSLPSSKLTWSPAKPPSRNVRENL